MEFVFFLFQLFDFADKYRGKYDSSISVAQKYYRSVSGYGVPHFVAWNHIMHFNQIFHQIIL